MAARYREESRDHGCSVRAQMIFNCHAIRNGSSIVPAVVSVRSTKKVEEGEPFKASKLGWKASTGHMEHLARFHLVTPYIKNFLRSIKELVAVCIQKCFQLICLWL